MRSRLFQTFLILTALISLGACDLAQNSLKADREGSMQIQDYRDSLASRVQSEETEIPDNKSGIPGLQPYIASPDVNMKPMPLVSLSVNQSVPLKDILFELAKQAGYDLELDPRISGSIIFTAREKPFDQVIERISAVAGLRYNFDENNVLRVELDTVYNKLYKVDYLTYVRSSSGRISNNVSVVQGEGADTGSSFSTSTTSEVDFWAELETNLTQILDGVSTGALKTKSTPQISVSPQNPNVQTVAPTGEDGFAPPDAVLNVESLPVDTVEDAAETSSANASNSFTINKQAGIINVVTTEKGHKKVAEYLQLLEKSVTAQVLIEAKILEVELTDEFATGIDWGAVIGGEFGFGFSGPISATGTSSFAAAYTGNDFQTAIQALSTFGTVKALASPRVTVLNNQAAVMNIADNIVYFELDIEVTDEEDAVNGDERRVEVTSEIKSVPEGVLVNVQPSINLTEKTISLALRPTITRIDRFVPNPALDFVVALNNLDPSLSSSAQIPQLNVQEIDSVIKVNSGQSIVLGGLLQDTAETTESGVPILSEAPMVGSLFKNHTDNISKRELVIFLKATIIDSPSDTIHATDKDLYRKYSSDRRPLKL